MQKVHPSFIDEEIALLVPNINGIVSVRVVWAEVAEQAYAVNSADIRFLGAPFSMYHVTMFVRVVFYNSDS